VGCLFYLVPEKETTLYQKKMWIKRLQFQKVKIFKSCRGLGRGLCVDNDRLGFALLVMDL
jgi:hypothetical protein